MIGQEQLRQGMGVVSADGDTLGHVKLVRQGDFLLDRPLQRDLYVPFDAVDEVVDTWVRLTIPARWIDGMGWPSPRLLAAAGQPVEPPLPPAPPRE